MNAAASQIHDQHKDPFSIASATTPQMLTKITRADMNLILPRLDDVIDINDPKAKEKQKDLQERIDKCVLIYRLGGHVVKSRTTKGKGDKDGVQFIGEFEARFTDWWAGKRFFAGRAHVPGSLEEMLYTQLVDSKRLDQDAAIDFLVDIGTKPPKPGKPSAVGYEWTVTPVVEVARVSNPVAALFERAQTTPRLAGPSSSESAAEAPAAARAAHGKKS